MITRSTPCILHSRKKERKEEWEKKRKTSRKERTGERKVKERNVTDRKDEEPKEDKKKLSRRDEREAGGGGGRILWLNLKRFETAVLQKGASSQPSSLSPPRPVRQTVKVGQVPTTNSICDHPISHLVLKDAEPTHQRRHFGSHLLSLGNRERHVS